MDHLDIPGNEPSLVILTKNELVFKKLKRNAKRRLSQEG